MAKARKYTIYDALEEKGIFSSNPANIYATDPDGVSIYKKAEYPRMFYHPDGVERVIVAAEEIVTPFGPKRVNEQREIIWEIAEGPEDEARLRAAGWHDHPTGAIKAAGKNAPMGSLENELERLQRENAALQTKLGHQTGKRPGGPS